MAGFYVQVQNALARQFTTLSNRAPRKSISRTSGCIAMLPALLDSVDRGAIDRLVADGVAESLRIEYKEQLPGTASGDKKEFLADVAAFANSGGGDLVFGIAERRDGQGKATGIPERVQGTGSINAEAECLRLDNMVRDGIAPRVPIRTVVVNGYTNGQVIIVRVPRTATGPHMVTFERHNKFYGRSNAGKFLLGIDDIRSTFNASGESMERISRFRDSRIAAVIGGETPSKVRGAALHVLLIPRNTFTSGIPFDPRTIGLARVPMPISGRANGGWVLEGIVARGGCRVHAGDAEWRY